MANIYPEKLPTAIIEDSKRRAEICVYTALRDGLPEDYTVSILLHST